MMLRNAVRYMLLSGGLMAVVATMPADAQETSPTHRIVNIVAERFVFTPSEITVEVGTTIEIRLTSDDTNHGFRLVDADGQEVNLTIPRRGRGHVVTTFAAKEAGDYSFECSHVCGAGHNFMRGRIRVKARAQVEAAE
jgi:cytochrome c oxidase subunit 2